MGITSFYFLCFFAAMLILYYCIPKKFQWGFLLLCSVAYYLLTGNELLILYPVVSVSACYAGGCMLARLPAEKEKEHKLVLLMTILVNI